MRKTAEDLMSGLVIYMNFRDDLAKAWKMMRDNSIRHLIVLDDEHDMVGILSDRDCLRAVRSESFPSARGQIVESTFPEGITIREFMRSPVKTVQFDASTDRIAEIMNEFKISALVVQSAGRVVGVVTEYDLLRDYIEIIRRT